LGDMLQNHPVACRCYSLTPYRAVSCLLLFSHFTSALQAKHLSLQVNDEVDDNGSLFLPALSRSHDGSADSDSYRFEVARRCARGTGRVKG
jgi:hypothetical protein